VRILPKIGPLRVLQLRTPTPQAERMFEASFDASLDRYRKLLDQEATGHLDLPNDNFDTGGVTGPGKYRLNDETHTQNCSTRSQSRTLVVLRRSFGPNSWNSSDIRMRLTRPSARPKSGRKFRPNSKN
jgi:hypothetical protein